MTIAWFDKRGIGMSDRFDEAPTLEQRNQDILAVMDTLGWERAHIVGQSEGGVMAQLFAADFPERVETVTLVNTVVSPRYYEAIPDFVRACRPAPHAGSSLRALRARPRDVGRRRGFMVGWELPSQAGNESFERWIARLMRFAASPRDFKRQLDSVFALDAGDAPERISAPTMVMHVQGDRVLPVAMGRLLADIIPGAEYVEIEGADHFFWIMPNWREVSDISIAFVTGKPVDRVMTRKFATFLFTDIVDSTRQSAAVGDAKWRGILDSHDRTARGLIDEHRGRALDSGDGLLAVFDLPSQGVNCGVQMCDVLRAGSASTSAAGIHAGEIEVHDDGDISGVAVNLAARRTARGRSRLWASSTVRDLMLGGSTSFTDRGEHTRRREFDCNLAAFRRYRRIASSTSTNAHPTHRARAGAAAAPRRIRSGRGVSPPKRRMWAVTRAFPFGSS